MERVGGRRNGRTLLDRPKPTVGCSASGRRKNKSLHYINEQYVLKDKGYKFSTINFRYTSH